MKNQEVHNENFIDAPVSEPCGDVFFDMTTKVSNTMIADLATVSPENEQINMLGLYEEDKNRFGKILRAMNLENITDFASTVRQSGHPSTSNSPVQDLPQPCSISCKAVYPPVCGSYHIVFPIEFADGANWMLKISANGDHFDSVTAAALESEARTMQMLKTKTSIPAPAVYAFDTTSNNGLSCPFILMEKLCGTPLSYQWFNSEVPKARLEHFRIKVLQNLAGVMVQLNKFTLNTGGALVFDPEGAPIGLGGAKVMDAVATYNKAAASRDHQDHHNQGGDKSTEDVLARAARSNAPNVSGGSQGDADHSDDEDITWERGPFSCPKAYFMSNLDRSDPAFRADAYERGTDMSLRLFVEWAFAESRNQDRPFVLTHPDLDVQNILVAEDGTVTGLIDWDGVAAVPREVGCAQYPLWLMRDWVPLRYRYDVDRRQAFDAGYKESSPAELASYRALYARFMELGVGKMTGGSDKATTFGTLPKNEAALTRRSLVMRSLDLSAGDPWAALDTVNHIIDQIEELTAPEWDDTDSDVSSITSCSSVRDSDDEINEEEEEKDAETFGQVMSGIRDDASNYQDAKELGDDVGSMPALNMKFSHSSPGVAEQEQVSPSSSDGCQSEVEAPKTQYSSQVHPQEDGIPTASGPLNWIRGLLRVGCDIAEECLREIAKIGYALEHAVDKVAEMLAEVETRHHGKSVESKPEQVVESECVRTEQSGGSQSTRDTSGRDLLMEVRPRESPTKQFPSVQVAFQSEQTKSAPDTVEAQDIPVRKAELLQAARREKKAEKKAIYLADKAAIKEELKVWEQIALCVWSRGTSLKQLRKNQFKIARWAVDLLREEQEREDRQLSAQLLPSAAEGTAAGAKMVDSGVTAFNSVEDDILLSKKESEEVHLTAEMLHVPKVDRDERSETTKTAGARAEDNTGLKSKAHRVTSEKPFQVISESENNTFDIYEDNKDESESSTAIPSGTQPQAASSPIQNSRTSKPFDVAKKMTKPVAARNEELLPALGNKTPSSELSADTILPKDAALMNKPAMPSDRVEMAGGLQLERKNIVDHQNAAFNLTNAIGMPQIPGSYPIFEDDDVLQYSEATSKIRAVCTSWTSYFTQIVFQHDQPQMDKESLSPNSSISSYNGDKENGRDVGGVHSSATSLSDGQAEHKYNEEVKEDGDNTLGSAVIATGEVEGGGDEDDTEPDKGRFEADRMREVKGRIDHLNLAAFIETSLKEQADRNVYDSSSGEWAEAQKVDKTIKAGSTAATGDEAQAGEAIDTGDSDIGGDKKNDDDQENQAAEDQGDRIFGNLEEFVDQGEFDHYTICNLLGRGGLDELRLLRLKEGFLKLLEQY